ncbi:hypothetical protein [Flavobacterium sp. 102]|uniref:hypothetical protein n=1 Tax=Flavobacterium sp. 102 TaxID=2135623 RepID=UPI000EAEE755|nr:hypothetical protein [Flavobacterium sp. 102]RKS02844.1 hypothetical protein C8C84_2574 [Flavobacterium sp. 102]
MITSEELINVVENDSTESNFKSVAENLLEAIRDWPKENLSEPIELISELKLEIKEKLTFENIERFSKTLKVEKDAWKIESLTSLLKVFEIEQNENDDGEIELEVLLERVSNRRK